MSDKYASLNQSDRSKLLYRHDRDEAMTASVEIIFNNEDRRLPNGKDEASIKRCTGVKKDEYFVDGKHKSKSDVVNLLESAGMSRSNPYYIVQQHKVNELMRMKDAERLTLLKEIAGTRTYDERRRESMRIMDDTDEQRQSIEEVIQYIEKRLSDLEGEKKELAQYKKLDNKRRSLEYTIYDKEEKEARKMLEEINDKTLKLSKKDLYMKVQQVTQQRVEMEESIATISSNMQRQRARRKQLQSKLRRLVQKQREIELKLNDGQKMMRIGEASRKEQAKELARVKKEIATAQKVKEFILCFISFSVPPFFVFY